MNNLHAFLKSVGIYTQWVVETSSYVFHCTRYWCVWLNIPRISYYWSFYWRVFFIKSNIKINFLEKYFNIKFSNKWKLNWSIQTIKSKYNEFKLLHPNKIFKIWKKFNYKSNALYFNFLQSSKFHIQTQG